MACLASNNKPQLHLINIFVTVALLLVTSTRTYIYMAHCTVLYHIHYFI